MHLSAYRNQGVPLLLTAYWSLPSFRSTSADLNTVNLFRCFIAIVAISIIALNRSFAVTLVASLRQRERFGTTRVPLLVSAIQKSIYLCI